MTASLLALLASSAHAQKKKPGKPAVPPAAAIPAAPVGPVPLAETLTGDAKAAYEGGKLLYGDGDFAGAKVKFQAAYDAAKDPRLLWNMAVCEKGLRHYARVVALTKQYLELGGSLITEEDRTEAKDLLSAIESFTVELSLDVNPAGAEIFIDGDRVGTAPLDKPLTVDIGAREINVQKLGFKPFSGTIPVGGQKQASLKVALAPELHEGELNINAPQGAVILIDGKRVGVGSFKGKLKSGGHTLRVEAKGMRPYQSEVVVQDDERRGVDVVLEPIAVAVPPPEKHGPLYDMEVGFRTGYGVMWTKAQDSQGRTFREQDVGFIPLWFDLGYRLGRPTYLGLYGQFGWLDKSKTCGLARHGADPENEADYAQRFGYESCKMVKAGIDVVFHLMPRTIVDPYFGFDVGVQGTFAKYRSYDPVVARTNTDAASSDGEDGSFSFQPGFQLGIDVHPTKDIGIGLFGHFAPHFGNEGEPKERDQPSTMCIGDNDPNCAPANSCTDCGGSDPGRHILLGTRIAYTFP
ncbi:MAG TPA: PEGA domain-containing protein [Polyangiaceae bacterium]|nr:PEGA domain-containing protein [Polyangiaceae bacterium]